MFARAGHKSGALEQRCRSGGVWDLESQGKGKGWLQRGHVAKRTSSWCWVHGVLVIPSCPTSFLCEVLHSVSFGLCAVFPVSVQPTVL